MKNTNFYVGIGTIVLILIVTFASAFYVINPGYTGVKVTLGKVSEKTYANGIGMKTPFITKIVKFDTRTQKFDTSTTTYTEDIQTADINYVFTYNLRTDNVNHLYTSVGRNYQQKLIEPVLTDAIKDVIGKYQAQKLVSNREQARQEILNLLKERLDNQYFENYTFQIVNLDYSDTFEKAIESKVTAEQKALEAKNKTVQVEEEAKQKVISAEADAKAMEIKAKALERNKALVEYEAVQKWDGQLPTYMMGNSVPFINLNK